MEKVFENKSDDDRVWIYESPDKGKTVYRREFGKKERELVVDDEDEWSLYGWHDFVHVVYMLQDVSVLAGDCVLPDVVQYEHV